MTRMTRLVGALTFIGGFFVWYKLGVGPGWAAVWTIVSLAVIWSAAAGLAALGGSAFLRSATFEMALVWLIAAGALLFVGLGRWLHDGLGFSVTAAAWTSIAVAVLALVAGFVINYRVGEGRFKSRAEPAADIDYPVSVQRAGTTPGTEQYSGIFLVTLNRKVPVVFVPDIADMAPPWDFDQYPAAGVPITTPAQARLRTAMGGPHSVTPHHLRHGHHEMISTPPGFPHGNWWTYVSYVKRDEFARYSDELARLEERQRGRAELPLVSELQEYEVIRLLQRKVLGPGRVHPAYAGALKAANRTEPGAVAAPE